MPARSTDPGADADLLRATERDRLRALVDRDIELARQLHADDFQLITPSGDSLSKEDYLGQVASGEVDYLKWEPEPIAVRLYGAAAIIRYRSELEVVVRGQKAEPGHFWHTDAYERRDGRWQVVWSHATRIR